mmetsp:Transcript_192/g.364  ORF Transcript_192/g.364 Transcript_192/m.364 type:complete len:222 (-) Transcript_192:754-1419(-)
MTSFTLERSIPRDRASEAISKSISLPLNLCSACDLSFGVFLLLYESHFQCETLSVLATSVWISSLASVEFVKQIVGFFSTLFSKSKNVKGFLSFGQMTLNSCNLSGSSYLRVLPFPFPSPPTTSAESTSKPLIVLTKSSCSLAVLLDSLLKMVALTDSFTILLGSPTHLYFGCTKPPLPNTPPSNASPAMPRPPPLISSLFCFSSRFACSHCSKSRGMHSL